MNCKKMLLFPGQGSQYVGIHEVISNNINECASDILGYDLKKKLTSATEEELANTLLAQPAIFAASLSALESLADKDYAAAGHSLGEYAALVACGVLDTENGFKAIKARSEIMSRVRGGGMAAVLGSDADVIEAACLETGGVYAVNYNSPQQTVIAGTLEALSKAEELLKAKGAKRVVRLNVSAAFHSEFMQQASEEFGEFAKGLTYGEFKRDFYSNVTGEKLIPESGLLMSEYLAKHMRSPVRFTDELYAAQKAGIDTFIEVGPGKTLTGLITKIAPDVRVYNVSDSESLAKTVEELNNA